MANLLAWVLFSFILSAIFARKPYILITGIIVLRLSVPWFVSNSLMQGLHMAGYLAVVFFVYQAVFYWPRIRKVLRSSVIEIAALGVLFTIALLNTTTPYAGLYDVLSNLGIIYIPGFIMYLLIKMEIVRNGNVFLRFFTPVFMVFMVVQYWLAVQQDVTNSVFIYESFYDGSIGWTMNTDHAERSQGTIETGLEFSALSAFAISLTYWVRNSLIRVALIVMMLYCCLLGTGRASLIIALVTAVSVILIAKSGLLMKVSSFAILIFGGLVLLSTEAGSAIIDKINDDGSSTELRFEALRWVARNYSMFIFGGYPGSRDLRSSGEIGSSLENAYLIAGMDYGLIFGVGLILLQISIALVDMKNKAGFIAGIGALGLIFSNLTNSGFTTNSSSAYLLWFALGFCSLNFLANLQRNGKSVGSSAEEGLLVQSGHK